MTPPAFDDYPPNVKCGYWANGEFRDPMDGICIGFNAIGDRCTRPHLPRDYKFGWHWPFCCGCCKHLNMVGAVAFKRQGWLKWHGPACPEGEVMRVA